MNVVIHTQKKIFLCRKKHQEYQLEMMLHYTPDADVFKVFKVSAHHMFLFACNEEYFILRQLTSYCLRTMFEDM
jgi:hypothetical protein